MWPFLKHFPQRCEYLVAVAHSCSHQFVGAKPEAEKEQERVEEQKVLEARIREREVCAHMLAVQLVTRMLAADKFNRSSIWLPY